MGAETGLQQLTVSEQVSLDCALRSGMLCSSAQATSLWAFVRLIMHLREVRVNVAHHVCH